LALRLIHLGADMIRYDRSIRVFAAGLSALAGFVDAIGFIKLGGFFVSFMSGNSTRLGVALAKGAALTGGALIALFVCGVVLGSLVGARAAERRPAAVLGLVCLLLTLAAGAGMMGWDLCAVVAMVLAMGAENGVFERDGEVQIGLTYMTGALVKLGQRITAALRGGNRWAWIPYLLLWLGLVLGAVMGALAYERWGLGSLWFAAAVAAMFTAIALAVGPMAPREVAPVGAD
jgi:uncharacterized membrane protein YoaK (UPF0700 family)